MSAPAPPFAGWGVRSVVRWIARSTACVGLLAGCASPATPPVDSFRYLHVIPTEQAPRAPGAGSPRIELEVANAHGLAAQLDPARIVEVDADRLVVDASGYPGGQPTRRTDFLSPSFVVDRDDPAVAAWADEIAARVGDGAGAAQLVAEVRAVILPNQSAAAYLIASEVLKRHIGDCSEHAVLFAALARALGIPTRVVHGVVIVRVEGAGLQAFGHAWNEIEAGGRWTRVDATPLVGGTVAYYLPTSILEDEGPGYALGMIATISQRPRAVRVLGELAD